MSNTGVSALMKRIGVDARIAARILSRAGNAMKSKAILVAADRLERNAGRLLAANQQDRTRALENERSPAMIDRLILDDSRIASMADGLRNIASLNDPVGQLMAEWERPNGLAIQRVRTPLGVVGVIYESRPNVTADAGALCLKSGNAVILRGGSDAFDSCRVIHECMLEGLRAAELPEAAIQMVPTSDRAAVGEMLRGLDGNLDVIVPRGGKSLVSRVQNESRVPVFSHLEGVCHVYIDRSASLAMAKAIVVNSKLRRPGICGAAETLLIDIKCPDRFLDEILSELATGGCEIRGDAAVCTRFPMARRATEADWSTEYLAPIISVKLVEGLDGAIAHIEKYSTGHTEAIVTDDLVTAARFLNELDSAILLHNASTQFADGGEFGMGAEIGIATGKLHARGPVGAEQMTSFNYRVRGNGQIRPI
jgi:glutamate-5-semialdehyde dehydrogenase